MSARLGRPAIGRKVTHGWLAGFWRRISAMSRSLGGSNFVKSGADKLTFAEITHSNVGFTRQVGENYSEYAVLPAYYNFAMGGTGKILEFHGIVSPTHVGSEFIPIEGHALGEIYATFRLYRPLGPVLAEVVCTNDAPSGSVAVDLAYADGEEFYVSVALGIAPRVDRLRYTTSIAGYMTQEEA